MSLFMACASAAVDYKKLDSHVNHMEKRSYPQMTLPSEIYEWLGDLEKDSGFTHKGVVVDNNGDICIFFEDEAGECTAIVILASQGGQLYPIGCEDAWEIYEDLCINKKFCNDNPYKGVEI